MKTHNDFEFEVVRLHNGDIKRFAKLIELFHEVFESDDKTFADKTHLQKLLGKEEFIVLAAIQGEKIIGGLTAYEMPLYNSSGSEVYIYDMAVDIEYQRKGIGKGLIAELKKVCINKNIKTIFVEAHATDRYAIDFYRSTGGNPEEVVHFNYEL